MEVEYDTNDWEPRRSKLELFVVIMEQSETCINNIDTIKNA